MPSCRFLRKVALSSPRLDETRGAQYLYKTGKLCLYRLHGFAPLESPFRRG